MQSIMNILEYHTSYCINQVTDDYIYKNYVNTKYGRIYLEFKYLMNYFICQDCKRLYKRLYLVNNEIKCRKCHNLYYKSETIK
jgi:hypothetical protein